MQFHQFFKLAVQQHLNFGTWIIF